MLDMRLPKQIYKTDKSGLKFIELFGANKRSIFCSITFDLLFFNSREKVF